MKLLLSLQMLLLLLILLLLLLFSFWWHYVDFCKYFLPKTKTNKKPIAYKWNDTVKVMW